MMLDGAAAEQIRQALEAAYQPGENFGSAFAKLMARVLAGRGIVLLDPLDSRLHRLAAPIYRRALEENGALAKELAARGRALDQAGYHAQVKVVAGNTLLFINVNARRQALRQPNHQFSAGRMTFSIEELLDGIEKSPEAFTPNVLLRPIVQDTLLPTAAYVGGPAEVAYFAQAEVLYRRLLGRMPAVLPRGSFTLVEPHLARLLRKYRLGVRDVLHGWQHLRAKMEREFLPKQLARRFSSGEKSIQRVLAGVRSPLGQLDPTLLGALDTAERKMLYQFLKLRAKAGRAEDRRTTLLDEHERALLNSLYPHRALQERTVCFLVFLARRGFSLLDELEERTGPDALQHQVLFL
jgi:bacillithiol biosynthesis cysteine-adding enzyme BshC